MLHALTEPDETASQVDIPDVAYVGRCPETAQELSIGPTPAVMHEARHLQACLEARRDAVHGFRTGHLLAPAAGKMFGVMLCCDSAGNLGTLRAFSGEWDTWEAPTGWVPSSGHLEEYADERRRTEGLVATLTRQIRDLQTQPTSKALRRQIEAIKIERGGLSRALTDRIHAAYRFDNALGESLPLTDVDTGSPNPPTGMGDCCAPKLLQAAVRNGLAPVGMVEFWWGSPSAVHPRVPGQYYGSCRAKCYPILGFLLRGVEAARVIS